jgi:hypothetical protein
MAVPAVSITMTLASPVFVLWLPQFVHRILDETFPCVQPDDLQLCSGYVAQRGTAVTFGKLLTNFYVM